MTIKEKVLDARKKFRDSKNMRLLCNTLIGEFDRISKDPTDEQCTQIIKKMIDSNKLTGNLDENKVLIKMDDALSGCKDLSVEKW